MRSGPAFRSSFLVLSAGWALGLGCLLNSNAFDSAGAAGTTTTTTTPAGGSTTTTKPPTGGTGGTTTTTTEGGAGAGGMMTTGGGAGAGGVAGSGGSTTTSTTTTTGPTTPVSCTDAKTQGTKTSGKVMIDPDGNGPNASFPVYCDMDFEKEFGWALLWNSVGDAQGTTTDFWNISFTDRLKEKGTLDPKSNYYNGSLYRLGLYFRDEVEDSTGKVFLLAEAQVAAVEGFDETTMKFSSPKPIAGNMTFYQKHFTGYWSSFDHDGAMNPDPKQNCAIFDVNDLAHGVSQHYNGCWVYNLGAGLDLPYKDNGWGPHILNAAISAADPDLGKIALEMGKASSRVNRISRFVRW
jgi:hypothetical protein